MSVIYDMFSNIRVFFMYDFYLFVLGLYLVYDPQLYEKDVYVDVWTQVVQHAS